MSTYLDLTGYHLTFDAEMTTSADLSKFSTTFANGDRTLWSNHEAEWYADYNPSSKNNPFSFDNGALNITASPAAGLPYDKTYSSGLIQTASTFTQNQGFFEIRAQVPISKGFWSAFWMLPRDNYQTEVDIFEQPSLYGKSQYYVSNKAPLGAQEFIYNTGVALDEGYHTYGFYWDSNKIQFTFDGQFIGTAHAVPPAMANQQMYILANLAVGDQYSWPLAPNSGTSASYKIDYIRAYSNDPNVQAVTLAPISSPDGKDTTPVGIHTFPKVAAPSVGVTCDTGAWSLGGSTRAGGVTSTGVEAGAPLLDSVDGRLASASYDPTKLADAAHTVLVTQTDVAGNTSTASSLSFTLDTKVAAPSVALTSDTGASSL
ncbi:family 16 glycosylhydrolase, partial [Methylobacterium sp. E-041]|uniref:family 16 glycosylhydrolase n=1 Tax=Methylobacterium sp. E-041 TaxID=2836573 RepID=UPI001FBBD4E7